MSSESGKKRRASEATAGGDDKEKKRQKNFKKLGKLLGKAWNLEGAEAFQTGGLWNLSQLGQQLDKKDELYYNPHDTIKHMWQAFATDLGAVYTTHIQGKTKHAKLAKEHLEQVKTLLSEKDASLGEMAGKAPPRHRRGSEASSSTSSKKRASASNHDGNDNDSNNNGRRASKKARRESSKGSGPISKHKPGANRNPEIAQRELKAMEALREFIVDKCGGTEDMLWGFGVRVTKKQGKKLTNQAKFDVNYFSGEEQRFRSMLEVGRFFGLVQENNKASKRSGKARGSGTKEQQAEKKQIRKEMDRLRKMLNRANTNLDKFEEKLQQEREQQEEENNGEKGGSSTGDVAETGSGGEATAHPNNTVTITRRQCAGTRLCDVTTIPSVPQHCIPDVLMTWDFLCTFHRVLSLQPIDLPDFCAALAYQPPASTDDLTMAPPVYLVESHLSLLKLLMRDEMSEDWWWSTVETENTETDAAAVASSLPNNRDDNEKPPQEDETRIGPVIKVDMVQLLNQQEDNLITTSWIGALEGISKKRGKAVRETIKGAIKVARNKWVLAYLIKALALFRSSSGGPQPTRQAIQWLVNRVSTARPDLHDVSLSSEQVDEHRTKVIEQCSTEMQTLSDSAPEVTAEDAAADEEYESEDDSDDEEEEEEEEESDKDSGKQGNQNGSHDERPATSIPPRPLPTLVDMLLPNEKPPEKAEYINAFSWAQMTGATVHRILHRKKRVFNEVDDALRANQDLAPLTVAQRSEREKVIAARVLTESYGKLSNDEEKDTVEIAIEHLCSGLQYLELSFVQRLNVLRLLIEAAYDSFRIHKVVQENYNQRLSAMRQLESEKKKAKNHAKEKAAADEAAAREKLAEEARESFLDEKRDEIRRLNEESKELSDEMVESLTDDDILDFDDDIKADFEALPAPESFSRAQVSARVAKMHEEAAFDTDVLKVLSFDELLKREQLLLEEMEGQLVGFGGEEALDDPSLDRETIHAIEALRREIDKTKSQAERLPEIREKAIMQLKDAIQDGTIKVLRNAVTAAKKAKLSGPDDETGGVWALDLMRDAALELENAKQNKKLIDAQHDLVSKRNKCFIRTEPVGRDRFGNRFWSLANEEDGNVWAEAEFSVKQEGEAAFEPPSGYTHVVRDGNSIEIGAADREEDFIDTDEVMDEAACRKFSRHEHHSSGFTPHLAQNHWGLHTSEESIRRVIKSLDGKIGHEKTLKASLQVSLEKVDQEKNEEENNAEKNDSNEPDTKTEGDEGVFATTKKDHGDQKNLPIQQLDEMSSALGEKVRVRMLVESAKDGDLARYETGVINGWSTKKEERKVQAEARSDPDNEEMEIEPSMETVEVPIWRVWTELGDVLWLDGLEVLEGLARQQKMESSPSYFEHDAAFLGYRNTLGKFSGSKADAPYASSPFQFAKLLVRKEGEMYPKLKMRSYDERWGGKTGERAAWTNKMKDYAFDTETVKQGLLTLELAFFWLTGEFEDYNLSSDETPDANALLENPEKRVDIELESDKNVEGLWNSPESRAVFIEVVSKATTTGFLALALELLCRNTNKYLKKHGLLNTRARETSYEDELPSRRSRRGRGGTMSYQEPEYDDLF